MGLFGGFHGERERDAAAERMPDDRRVLQVLLLDERRDCIRLIKD